MYLDQYNITTNSIKQSHSEPEVLTTLRTTNGTCKSSGYYYFSLLRVLKRIFSKSKMLTVLTEDATK
jgi:hypothetical protein